MNIPGEHIVVDIQSVIISVRFVVRLVHIVGRSIRSGSIHISVKYQHRYASITWIQVYILYVVQIL